MTFAYVTWCSICKRSNSGSLVSVGTALRSELWADKNHGPVPFDLKRGAAQMQNIVFSFT